MRKLTHSESEIVNAVKELEAGVPAETVCRRLNVSKSTLYQWRRKYSGMDASSLARLKELEAENARLKRMYADAELDNRLLEGGHRKKTLTPAAWLKVAGELSEVHGLSVARACVIVGVHRSHFYYSHTVMTCPKKGKLTVGC